jgi:hypothetical protein
MVLMSYFPSFHIPQRKHIHMLRLANNNLGLKFPGVYQISCECSNIHIVQPRILTDASCKEHMRHMS